MGPPRAMLPGAGQWAAPKPQPGADPRPAGPGRAAPGSPRSWLPARRDGPPPVRPPRARPAYSPADCLVGQLLHAVELLLHGGDGGGSRPRVSGRGELGTVWRFLHRFPAREAAAEATIRPRPRRVTSSAVARPLLLDRVGPNRAERTRNQRGGVRRCGRIEDGWS